jgi:hypothetical protein
VRRKLGAVLAFLGGFLVVLAVLAQVYAPGQLMKTPLDVDSTTRLSGTAEISGESTPVKATSITHSDTAKSDDDVIVFQNSSCLVKDEGDVGNCVSADEPQERLLAASVDDFATDRVSAEAVNDPEYLPADAAPHEGLVNKWPFDAEKKTYPYWNGTVGSAVDAVYDRTETVGGVETYVYRVESSNVPIEIAEGVPGFYADRNEIYIEPLTGAMVHQVQHQERTLEDGTPVLVLDLAFTDEQVAANGDDAKSNRDSLNLATRTVPLVGYALGIPLLMVGIALMLLSRRKGGEPSLHVDSTRDKTPVSS